MSRKYLPTNFVDLWNDMIDFLARNRILGVNLEKLAPFRHPWNVRPKWSGRAGLWTVQVHPGFVNSEEVEARLPVAFAPGATLSRLDTNRVGGRDRFVESLLTESPSVPVFEDRFRAIGIDSVDGEAVPQFFAKLGAVDVPPETGDIEFGLTKSESGRLAEKLRNRRLLRAAEVVLRIPRIHAKAEVVYDGAGVPDLQVIFQPPQGAPRLQFYPRVPVDAEPEAGAILGGGWQDTAHHTVHLATFYLLSPVGAVEGSTPDETWSPYVRHHQYWNLKHSVKLPAVNVQTERLVAPGKFLAGGAAGNILQFLEDDINAARALADLMLAKVKVESRVWSV